MIERTHVDSPLIVLKVSSIGVVNAYSMSVTCSQPSYHEYSTTKTILSRKACGNVISSIKMQKKLEKLVFLQ